MDNHTSLQKYIYISGETLMYDKDFYLHEMILISKHEIYVALSQSALFELGTSLCSDNM